MHFEWVDSKVSEWASWTGLGESELHSYHITTTLRSLSWELACKIQNEWKKRTLFGQKKQKDPNDSMRLCREQSHMDGLIPAKTLSSHQMRVHSLLYCVWCHAAELFSSDARLLDRSLHRIWKKQHIRVYLHAYAFMCTRATGNFCCCHMRTKDGCFISTANWLHTIHIRILVLHSRHAHLRLITMRNLLGFEGL